MYIVASVAYTRESEGICVETFDNEKQLLNYLINDLELCTLDYDYEPDDNYESDLETVIDYLYAEFAGDGSFSISMITIQTDQGDVLYSSGV